MQAFSTEEFTDADYDFIAQTLMKYGSDDAILDLSELDGFLTAIVSGPDSIPPSIWLPAIWGGDEHSSNWDSEAEFKRFFTLVIRYMNSIVDVLMNEPNQYEPVFNVSALSKAEVLIIEEWCFGFMRAVDLGNWPPMDNAASEVLQLIEFHGREENFAQMEALTLQEHQANAKRIASGIKLIHAYWLAKRAHLAPKARKPVVNEPKVGRNEPCPCGSGKKFKQCCLH